MQSLPSPGRVALSHRLILAWADLGSIQAQAVDYQQLSGERFQPWPSSREAFVVDLAALVSGSSERRNGTRFFPSRSSPSLEPSPFYSDPAMAGLRSSQM